MSADALLLAAVAALAAGVIGCFAVMRRMSLAADALSHVALPGIGIAIAIGIHPLLGAVVLVLFGALLVWALEDRARLSAETIIGVVFSAALAVGSMLTPGEDLIDALFGRAGHQSTLETISGFVAALGVLVFSVRARHRLVLAAISPDLARTAGINIRRLEFFYLQAFAIVVALGLRFLGVLLMGSLIIIPAATAKLVSRNLNQMLIVSGLISAGVTVGGALVATQIHQESGPVIVSLAAVVFAIALARQQIHGR